MIDRSDDDDIDDIDDDEYGDDEAALIPCPECGQPVDDDSPRCPACGHWITEEDAAARRPLWVVVTALLCLAVAVALAVLV